MKNEISLFGFKLQRNKTVAVKTIRTYEVPLEDLLKKYNIKGKIINLQYKSESSTLKIEVEE